MSAAQDTRNGRRNGNGNGRDTHDRGTNGGGMNWAKRLIEYALVVLVAIIVSMLLIWVLFPKAEPCTDCVVPLPDARAECDKQFYSTGSRARQLAPGAEDELWIGYEDESQPPDYGSSGYSSPSSGGYSSPSGGYSTTPAPTSSSSRGRGYVMIRTLPQGGYDYQGQSSGYGSSYDTTSTRPETTWDEVTVTVARYATQLRNDSVCAQAPVRFREGRFESFCSMTHKFDDAENAMISYRVFVRNDSSVPLEYCIVSNCSSSGPFAPVCKSELQPLE